MKQYALNLSFDGSKCFFELGMWTAFKEMNINILNVTSSYLGCINATFIAQGDLDLAVKFWSNAVKNNIFKVSEVVAELYSSKWANEDGKTFKKSFLKFITGNDPRVVTLRNFLNEYIDEQKIRKSSTVLTLNVINPSNLEIESLLISEIPKGRLVNYIVASICFPQIAKASLDKNFSINTNEKNIMSIYENGYKNIITTDENEIINKSIIPSNMITIKASEFVGLSEEYSGKSLKKNIKKGYLDTLKTFKLVKGYRYYLCKESEKDIQAVKIKSKLGVRYNSTLDDVICRLLNIDAINKTNFDNKVVEILEKTKLSREDIFLSILENLAITLNIQKNEKYKYDQLINKITEKVNENIKENSEALNDKSYLNLLISTPVKAGGVSVNIFSQYFILLIATNPDNYDKLQPIFKSIPENMALAMCGLIYILY